MERSPLTLTTPDGVDLAAVLRLPDQAPARAGVVLTGPFTGVKEQVVGVYAAALADHGLATLALDHRNFGASGGAPRQHEDPDGKLTDLRTAVTHMLARVESVGLLGVCLGAGYALKAAAFDPRVSALATVAGAYNSPQQMRAAMGGEAYRAALAELLASGAATRPAVAAEGPAAMPGPEPFAYYGTARGRVPGWRNEVTDASIHALLTLDAAVGADFVSPTPVRIIHGTSDDYCSPQGAQEVFDRLGEPRDLVWIDTTNHIDLYDQPAYVDQAVRACAEWFARHL